jgi:hypothetical protein
MADTATIEPPPLEKASTDRIAELERQATAIDPNAVAALEERFGKGKESSGRDASGRFQPKATDPVEDDGLDDDADDVDVVEAGTAAPTATTNSPAPGQTQAAPAKTAQVATNDSARPSAPWQPGDDELALAQSLGLDQGDVRGFRDAESFYRFAAKQRQRQSAAATSPTAKTSEIEKLINDPINAGDPIVAALKEVHEQNAAMRQQLEGLNQFGRQQTEVAQRRQQAEIVQRFDSVLDDLAADLFGKTATQTPEQTAKRDTLFRSLMQLGQAGAVQQIDRESVERVFAFAFPQEFKEQLRRSQVTAARKQAQQRLGAGKSTSTPRTAPQKDPRNDPEVQQWAREAGIQVA